MHHFKVLFWLLAFWGLYLPCCVRKYVVNFIKALTPGLTRARCSCYVGMVEPEVPGVPLSTGTPIIWQICWPYSNQGGQILPTFFLLVLANILTFRRACNVQSVLLDRKEERHGGLSYIGRSPYPKEGRCYQVFLDKPINSYQLTLMVQ